MKTERPRLSLLLVSITTNGLQAATAIQACGLKTSLRQTENQLILAYFYWLSSSQSTPQLVVFSMGRGVYYII